MNKAKNNNVVTIKWGQKNENIQNVIIKNVELWWAKLDPKAPVEPFGTLQWEIQIRFPATQAEEMEPFGTASPVKDNPKLLQINLKKKAEKADGTPAKSIVVFSDEGDIMDGTIVGNGSRGAVKLMLRDYEIKNTKGKVTKEGTAVSVIQVQISDLVEYRPTQNTFDFDDEEDEQPVRRAATTKKATPKIEEEEEVEDSEDDEEEEEVQPAKKAKTPVKKQPAKVEDDELDDEDEEEEVQPAKKPAMKKRALM